MNSILITGGTGSFGRAFARSCLRHHYKRVCIYSRSEHAQATMREDFGNDERLRFFIGDVRDCNRLERAMHEVDVVVHAAALKRIEVGHYNPEEMVKTNVLGALNVIEAARRADVARVVGLSSDKAWQPISPYGQSKAIAESLMLAADRTSGQWGPRFAVTRYGNVAGSAGSVIPKWRELLAAGATHVPVTDPECTRFYMTMQEAIGLVEVTIGVMKGGELMIPDYLPAYRLGDLAEAMGATMDVTGLQPWEKLHEGMRDDLTSDKARRMTVDELREALSSVE